MSGRTWSSSSSVSPFSGLWRFHATLLKQIVNAHINVVGLVVEAPLQGADNLHCLPQSKKYLVNDLNDFLLLPSGQVFVIKLDQQLVREVVPIAEGGIKDFPMFLGWQVDSFL